VTAQPKERMPIAVRAYAAKAPRKKTGGQQWWRSGVEVKPSNFSLTFDTETTVDAAQQLRVGAYQFRERTSLLEEGFFYDPESLSAAELATLRRYATECECVLRTRSEFIDDVFFGLAFQRNAAFVGFNLPFDISRIAEGHDSARRNMRGGFTFKMSGDPQWPRLQVKHLSRTAALIRFAGVEGQRAKRSARKKKRYVPVRRGFFCDVRSLGRAVTGRPDSLKSLADLLETEHRKLDGDHGQELDDEYLMYLRGDVQVTWECFDVLRERYEGYQLRQTSVFHILSEASVGKACLKEMGVRPWRECSGQMTPGQLGVVMSTYYGGRSEVHIRREVRQVLYCDFLSMYPTVSALMSFWRFTIAEGVSRRDATAETRTFLDAVTLDDLARPEAWLQLAVLCQVGPDEDILPVRAAYDEGSQGLSIGLNHLTSRQPLWYTLADVVTSKLLTGRVPRIRRAWRFLPGPIQSCLQPIDILGNPDYRTDPAADDFYRRNVDLRSEVKRAARRATDEQTRRKLNAGQQAMKIAVNATCYGIFVELNVQERAKQAEVTFYGSDGMGTEVHLASVEEEGRYFHPLIATLTTGGARLMLGMAEALTEREGISWALCDTDSMALARPVEMEQAEFIARARRVQEWFEQLNPYERQRGLFKLEDANFGLDGKGGVTDELEPLYCLAVSAKRYVLFNVDADGRPVLRKASGHGLGHLSAPYGPDDAPVSILEPQVDLRDDLGVERWQYDLWYRIAQAALEGHPQQVDFDGLPGFEKKAMSRYAATTPRLARWFKSHNDGRPYREQVRPFGFLNAFLAKSRGQLGLPADSEPPRAVAPYDHDPAESLRYCFDRETCESVDPEQLKSYRQALAQYHLHPEAKFLGGDYVDTGELQRRHMEVAYVEHIGKEANRWEEQFHLGEDPQAQVVYGRSGRQEARFAREVRGTIRRLGVRRTARETGLSLGLVSQLSRGKAPLTARTLCALRCVGVESD